jgi:hypothetical protein
MHSTRAPQTWPSSDKAVMGNTDSTGIVDDDIVKRRAISKMDSEMRSKMNRGVNYNSTTTFLFFDFND